MSDLAAKVDDSFSKKVNRGAILVTLAMMSGRILTIVSGIILTRLLVPEDFGLIAIAMAIITFFQSITQTGFAAALIQKQKNPDNYLNSAWTVELVKYFILFLSVILIAPYLAIFFKESRATSILRVISFSFLFFGFRNIGVIYFRKNLDFKKQFVLDIIPLAANVIIVIPLVLILRNVWALVWTNLANSAIVCIISYILHPYRPRLEFNLGKAKELFKFGKWILGGNIIVMIQQQGITMFIGRFLGIPLLGYYNRGIAFSSSIFNQIVDILWKVGFPAYSQLQNDLNRFKNVYLKTSQLMCFIGMPLVGGIIVLGKYFIILFLTEKWLPVAPLIQILSMQSMFIFINTPSLIVFNAVGKPSIETKTTLFGAIIIVVLVYPFSYLWGLKGTAFTLFLSTFLKAPVIFYLARKILECSLWEFSKPILLPFINTCIMILSILIIKNTIFHDVNIGGLVILVFLGMISYFFVAYQFDKYFDYGVFRLLKDRIWILW